MRQDTGALVRKRLQNAAGILRAGSTPAGKLDAIRVLALNRRNGVGEPVPFRLKMLGGDPILVRPGTSDIYNAAWYGLGSCHLPPPEVASGSLTSIVELGSNIGAALTALGVRYPSARLVGLEADAGNVRVARANIERFGDRAEIVHSAIWEEPAQLVVDREVDAGEHGFVVRVREPGDPPDMPAMDAITIDDLFEQRGIESADYMHVSIEGTEPRVLGAGGAWPDRVRSLTVEVHPYFGYLAADCVGQLEALGYRAWPRPDRADKWVYAVRR
jgi:FkbM family methyltransferase